MNSDNWQVASQAVFRGCIVQARWPVGDLKPVLPPGVSLDSTSFVSDTHPIVFLFGEQRTGAWLLNQRRIASPLVYHEVLITAPHLDSSFWPGPAGVVVKGFCNYAPAAFVGRSYYGYDKSSADLGWRDTRWVCTAEGFDLAADVTAHLGETRHIVTQLESLLAAPLYGVRDDGVGAVSQWQLDFGHARARTARATFQSERGFLGQHSWEGEGLIVEDVPWTLLLHRMKPA